MSNRDADFEARIEKLETQNRRLISVLVILLLVPTALALMGQSSASKTIRANRIVLEDDKGTKRAELFVDDVFKASNLVLYDTGGKKRAELNSGILGSGAALQLLDENSRARAAISASGPLGGTVALLSEKGVPGNILQTDSANLKMVQIVDSQLEVLGKNGKRVFIAPGLVAVDRVEEKKFAIGMSLWNHLDGTGQAILTDSSLAIDDDEGFGVTVGSSKLTQERTGEKRTTSAASVILTNTAGNVIWKTP